MPITTAINPDHIVLRVKDPAASVDFYSKTLGLAPVRLEEYQAGESDATDHAAMHVPIYM